MGQEDSKPEPESPSVRPKTSSNRPVTSKDRRRKAKSPDNDDEVSKPREPDPNEPQVLGRYRVSHNPSNYNYDL